MAEEAIEDAPEEVSGGGLMKKLVFAGIGLVLVGVGVFVGPMVMKDDAAETAEEEVEADPGPGPAFYTSLHPPLVVNFTDSLGDAHFMQVTLEVMSHDQVSINAVREHAPAIRNSLILLYSNVLYEEVITREGKEKMLADGLVEVQNVMTERTGEPAVEALYFTGLVIQ